MQKRVTGRVLALLLVLALVVGSMPLSAFADSSGNITETFIDEATGDEIAEAEKHSAAYTEKTPQTITGYEYSAYTEETEHVYSHRDLQYIYGYPDKTVRGERYLSRAEAAAIFYRLYEGTYPDFTRTMTDETFRDVSKTAWYYTDLKTVYNIGITDGYEDGTYRPDEPVTRADFAIFAAKFAELELCDTSYFSDVTHSHEAYQYINAAAKAGWIQGYPDKTYKPDADISRTETVTFINTLINRSITVEELEALGIDNPYVDLKEDYWGYCNLMEATVKHSGIDWHGTDYNAGEFNVITECFVDEDGNEIAAEIASDGKAQYAYKPIANYEYLGYITKRTFIYSSGRTDAEFSKEINTGTASVGDKLTYTLTAGNGAAATAPIKNATITDVIPAGLDFVDGSVYIDGTASTAYSYENSKKVLVIQLGDIKPDSKIVVTFSVMVNNSAYNTTIENLATLEGDNSEPVQDKDTGVIIGDGLAKPAITKKADKQTVRVGVTVTYTVTMSNSDLAEVPVRNAKMSDVIPEYLTFSHGSLLVDGVTFGYAYDNSTKQLTVELGDIAPGQEKIITFAGVVNSTAYGVSFTNTAVLSSDNAEDKTATDDSIVVDVGLPDGRSGYKAVDKATAKVGDTLTYTISISNSALATADWSGMTLTDKIPEYIAFQTGSVQKNGQATTEYSYDANSKTLTLMPSTIAIGETVTFTFTAEVLDGAQGRFIVNTAILKDNGNETPLPDTGVQIEDGQIEPMITKTASVTEAYEGDIFTYEVKLKNGAGATANWRNVILTDVIPDGLKLVAGSVSLNNQTVSYGISGQAIEVTVGDIRPNEEVTVKFDVRVLASAVGTTVTNVAVGKGDNGDKTGTDPGVDILEPDDPNAPNKPTGSKTVDKTLVNAGDKVTFTIKVFNNSDTVWTGVQVYDVLDTSMVTLINDTIYIDGIRYPETSGKWTFADRQLVYTLGDINPGQEILCTFDVLFKNDAAGHTYTNTATLKGTDGRNVFVKAPEILVLGGTDPFFPNSDIHYKLFSGQADHLGNPLYLWTPDDSMTLQDMCRVGYRLMTDSYRISLGNGSISVPGNITNREVQFFISHGVIAASEYVDGTTIATQAQIDRILNYSIKAGLLATGSAPMKRIAVAQLICNLTGRDMNPNTSGLPLAHFTDKGGHVNLIDEVSNGHEYTVDSSGNETWTVIID